MPDFLLRGIDRALAECIQEVACERNVSIGELIILMVRQGLGEGGDAAAQPLVRDIARLGGTRAPDESDAFRKALAAFEDLPESDKPFGSGRRGPGR